jgi:hypothetical protein
MPHKPAIRSFTDRFSLQPLATANTESITYTNTVFVLVLKTQLVYGHWLDPLAMHGSQLVTKQLIPRWLCFGRLGALPFTTR